MVCVIGGGGEVLDRQTCVRCKRGVKLDKCVRFNSSNMSKCSSSNF